LSVKDATELKAEMLRAYLGDGHESIALMFMEPVMKLATDSTKGWATGDIAVDGKDATKKQLLEMFCAKGYPNSSTVPFLFIPACGKLYIELVEANIPSSNFGHLN
jgi:hypothetical protein